MRIEGIGTQLYVWSQLLGKEGKTVEGNVNAVLSEVREAGFEGAEWNLSAAGDPERAASLKRSYDALGLRIPSLYNGGAYHVREEAERTVAETLRLAAFAAEIGCPAVSVNPNPIGRDKTDEELTVQAETLNELGEGLRKLGMELYVHNHDPEIRSHAREFRANLALTDPNLVHFCVDTHWVYRGGEDPVALLREAIHRTRSLHLRNSVNGVWSESFGEGDIDHRRIHQVLEEGDFKGWLLLELAYEGKTTFTRSFAENLQLARKVLRETFGM